MRKFLAYVVLFCLLTFAEFGTAELQNKQLQSGWITPIWVSGLDDFEIEFIDRVRNRYNSLDGAVLDYRFPNGKGGSVELYSIRTQLMGRYAFTVPMSELEGLGKLQLRVLRYSPEEEVEFVFAEHSIPIGFAKELDITGEAAEVLLYPLPDDNYIARYIPCCNIYGGMTYAARVPVNPTETDEGLPAHLVSPFIVLEPDGMSASTMGLYLDMKYDPESFPGKDGRVALYELNLENTWSEVLTYQIDAEKSVVTTHCPEGGSFVLAWVKK